MWQATSKKAERRKQLMAKTKLTEVVWTILAFVLIAAVTIAIIILIMR